MRYFSVAYTMKANGNIVTGDLSFESEVFPSKTSIKKSLHKESVDSIVILNIFEFKDKKDFRDSRGSSKKKEKKEDKNTHLALNKRINV